MVTSLRAATLVAFVLGGAACAGESTAPAPSPPPAESAPDDDAWFTEETEATGLAFTHVNGRSGRFYFPEMLPAGAGLFDYDRDGDLDVYLTQGGMLDDGAVAPSRTGRLFRNDLEVAADGTRTLRFTNVTAAAGIDAPGYGMGVATGDATSDGCTDLYLTNFGPNQLFRNNCDGTFTDVSADSGTDDPGWGVSASFVDYDRDGRLDLYVGNYVQYDVRTDRPCTGLTGRRDYCTPDVYPPQADRLYRNEGNGRFADVTAAALRDGAFGPALGVSAADFTGDGWADIYVANDLRENLLWVNQQDGTFRERGLVAGVALSADGVAEASMGVDAGDYDNDGDLDLYMTHLPAEGNNLYENDGTGQFEDVSIRTRLGPSSRGASGFGTAWIDVDNDGWLDLVAVNGAIEAIEARGDAPFPYDEPNRWFRNLGDGRFEDATARAGPAFALSDVSRGAAFGDLDNDGDTDIVVANNGGPARLLINRRGSRHAWLGLRLVGRDGADRLGTRVAVATPDGPRWRHAHTDGSYASANDPRVLVGLGPSAAVSASVRVTWPDGQVEVWNDVPVNRYTALAEGQGTLP